MLFRRDDITIACPASLAEKIARLIALLTPAKPMCC
jgi:hypothetical protein